MQEGFSSLNWLNLALAQKPVAGVIGVLVAIILVANPAKADSFVHPGALHTEADFDRMKARVAQRAPPWIDGSAWGHSLRFWHVRNIGRA
jgi:hypothetical protein